MQDFLKQPRPLQLFLQEWAGVVKIWLQSDLNLVLT
jgi:hypothetical protein